jgi:hypothetical protein
VVAHPEGSWAEAARDMISRQKLETRIKEEEKRPLHWAKPRKTSINSGVNSKTRRRN